jgi:hypothetical protein
VFGSHKKRILRRKVARPIRREREIFAPPGGTGKPPIIKRSVTPQIEHRCMPYSPSVRPHKFLAITALRASAGDSSRQGDFAPAFALLFGTHLPGASVWGQYRNTQPSRKVFACLTDLNSTAGIPADRLGAVDRNGGGVIRCRNYMLNGLFVGAGGIRHASPTACRACPRDHDSTRHHEESKWLHRQPRRR